MADEYGTIQIESPSGAKFEVMTEEEAEYFDRIASQYYSDNVLSNVADRQDLDRVLMMELLVYRWSSWMLAEVDYSGDRIDPQEYKNQIRDYGNEIRQTKKMLGIDKKSREGEGQTVADYIENLRQRAKEFGVMRNDQAAKSIELFQELSAFIQLYLNTDDIERKEQRCDQHDIINWIIEVAIPEFNDIDAKFRETSQKYWIQEI